MWILTITEKDGAEGRTFRLTNGSIRTVGRAPRADFILDAPLVSRLHCRLSVRQDGALEIHDLESTNGTYVNGRKIERAQLKDGDEVGVGRVTLRVQRVQ